VLGERTSVVCICPSPPTRSPSLHSDEADAPARSNPDGRLTLPLDKDAYVSVDVTRDLVVGVVGRNGFWPASLITLAGAVRKTGGRMNRGPR
jgi:hypothetical protein